MYHNNGVPILTLDEKLDALKYCMQRGHDEDSLGHIFDLIYHVCPEWKFLRFKSFEEIARYYGNNPTPIRLAHS